MNGSFFFARQGNALTLQKKSLFETKLWVLYHETNIHPPLHPHHNKLRVTILLMFLLRSCPKTTWVKRLMFNNNEHIQFTKP